MIKIIAKGYKYLLTQIDDFLDSARTIVISLKSVKAVLHQLDQKIIYLHYDSKHLTETFLKSE